MKMALEGIKVIDVSQVIAVPVAARHLADFGADVIHVEHPERGDFWRAYLQGVGGISSVASPVDYNWEAWNRNKKSLAIDLGQERGRELMYKLVEQSDIFTTNLRLWEREKLGLQYETLKKVNPRLIYGSVTGLGKEGPRKKPACLRPDGALVPLPALCMCLRRPAFRRWVSGQGSGTRWRA